MARKLTEEERNNINLLTAALVAALPAHLRSQAGAVASSLVRIPRETIKPTDVNRIVGRCGENAKQKDELRAAIRELALEPVEVEDGAGEQFVLRIPEAGETAEIVATASAEAAEPVAGAGTSADAAADAEGASESPVEAVADAVAGAAGEAVDQAEPAPAPEKKRRRRRRVGDKGGVKAEPQAVAGEPAAAEDGEGAQPVAAAAVAAAMAETDADSAPVADADAAFAEAEPALVEAADAAQVADAPAPEKKRRRTRRSRKKPASAPNSEAPTQDAPMTGSGQATEAVLAGEPAGDVAERPAPEDDPAPALGDAPAEPDAQPVPAANAEQPVAEPEPESEPGPQPEPDPAPAPGPRNSRGRGRRGGNGRGQGGNPKQQGKTLAEVPYIRRGGQTEADLRARIVQLDQRFWMNGWLLSHPGAFQLYEKELLALNEFVVNGTMIGDVTRRQLAYQMGGDEKFFEYGSDGFKLLRSMGVEDLIRHRPMPKADLVFHAPRRRKHMRVLVTENLDPWLDVHDLMYEDGVSQILGERIHAVVLGGGMPVLEQNRLHLLLDTLGADSYEVLYWGDIDRAGLDILIKLQALLEGKFEVKPFTPAYQLMCDRAMERFPDPADNEKTGQINVQVGDTAAICDGLTPEAAEYARAVIEGCGLVPQEILTKRDL